MFDISICAAHCQDALVWQRMFCMKPGKFPYAIFLQMFQNLIYASCGPGDSHMQYSRNFLMKILFCVADMAIV